MPRPGPATTIRSPRTDSEHDRGRPATASDRHGRPASTPPSWRELGIPAVVGTPNATMRPRDGDRIRVDAERGTVEPLA
ncbi:hypothetical protein FH608_015765 [Nonomuraea phyllanthi]|uniref:PEP-utilising enzyme mobile domain-containing protein n=1 Tax=Nonomuraea phyllanthi TaxID=2219224 RepID=A0A5C4WK59_9ACTN|nr:PEP-utilizing enzyme [Nonomuraea phyllanthi]KAB8194640.1 hypothetical protein FH608_015765 [Nonomuraea phyllanthi]